MNGSVYILYIVSNWTEYMGCICLKCLFCILCIFQRINERISVYSVYCVQLDKIYGV